jgi:AraC-like DNA-binding protein
MHLGGATLARLCLARSLLELPDGPSVGEVARRVRLSRFHFIRQFEAAFGSTPCAYRTQVRLAAAKVLLAQGKPVTEVCLDVGFSSLGSFSRLFQARCGTAPSAYRRRFYSAGNVTGRPSPRLSEPHGPSPAGIPQIGKPRGRHRTQCVAMRIKLTSIMVEDRAKRSRSTRTCSASEKSDFPSSAVPVDHGHRQDPDDLEPRSGKMPTPPGRRSGGHVLAGTPGRGVRVDDLDAEFARLSSAAWPSRSRWRREPFDRDLRGRMRQPDPALPADRRLTSSFIRLAASTSTSREERRGRSSSPRRRDDHATNVGDANGG